MNTNSITITGNIGRDGETKDGDRRTYATSRMGVYQGKDKDTLWLSLTAFSGFAVEDLGKVVKGQRVTVTGRLSFRTYTTQDGDERQDWGVIVENVDKPRDEQPRQQQSGGGRW